MSRAGCHVQDVTCRTSRAGCHVQDVVTCSVTKTAVYGASVWGYALCTAHEAAEGGHVTALTLSLASAHWLRFSDYCRVLTGC
eukprot:3256546-Rhodomonas_salina.1